jgi:hypothetical protein
MPLSLRLSFLCILWVCSSSSFFVSSIFSESSADYFLIFGSEQSMFSLLKLSFLFKVPFLFPSLSSVLCERFFKYLDSTTPLPQRDFFFSDSTKDAEPFDDLKPEFTFFLITCDPGTRLIDFG